MNLPQSLPKTAWILWKDACFQNDGNVSIDEVNGPIMLFSAGIFVKETDEFISIAIDKDIDGEREHTFRNVQTIPKVNIIDYHVLESHYHPLRRPPNAS